MRRRSKAGGEPAKLRRRKTVTLKRGNAPKAVRRRSSSHASELHDALQQQTATSEVLRVISRAPFDLQTVLDTLVQLAARLCEAEIANIWRPKDGVYRMAASSRSKEYLEKKEYLETVAIEPNRRTVTGRALLDGKTVHVHDVQGSDYNPNAVVVLGGYRTVLSVPLLSQGVPIGAIALTRSTVRPFTKKQIELVETFADQAVIAIENTRLFEAEQQRSRELTESLEQQTAAPEVLQVINSSPGDVQPVFETMLESAVRICDAKFGNIYRWDGNALHNVASHNVPSAFAEARRRSPRRPSPENPTGRMIANKAVIQSVDLATEQAYVERDPEIVAAVELGGVRSFLAVPTVTENELIGSFSLSRQDVRPFTNKKIALVTSVAIQAVIAIENARLLNELRQRTDDPTERTAEVSARLPGWWCDPEQPSAS